MPKSQFSEQVQIFFPTSVILPDSIVKFTASHGPIESRKIIDSDTFIGIEIEVERIASSVHHVLTPEQKYPGLDLWQQTGDNSLKEQGVEFVSRPLKGRMIEVALNALNNFLVKENPAHNFSSRCGTHIHVDFREMTMEEVIKFVLLYSLVEGAFYHFAGKDRIGNAFCVPITHAPFKQHLPEIYHAYKHEDLAQVIDYITRWSKYTGLNLRPLSNLGTVEFRHYGGTADITFLIGQINSILNIRKRAKEMSMEQVIHLIKTINTSSLFRSTFSDILGIPFNIDDATLKKITERSVLSLKQVICHEDFISVHTKMDSEAPLFKHKLIGKISYVGELKQQMKHLLKAGDTQINKSIQKLIKSKIKPNNPYHAAFNESKREFRVL